MKHPALEEKFLIPEILDLGLVTAQGYDCELFFWGGNESILSAGNI